MPNGSDETGINRRTLLQNTTMLGASAGLASIAGCSGASDNQDTTQETTPTTNGDTSEDMDEDNGTGAGQTQAPPFQIIELVEPPVSPDYSLENPERDIVYSTHISPDITFFIPTKVGMQDAARQLGWNVSFEGPSGSDVEAHINQLGTIIDRDIDALATIVPQKTQGYERVINRALDNDIAVVTYNTNPYTRAEMREKFGQALGFTGQRHFSAGWVSGLQLIEHADTLEQVTLATCCPEQSAHLERLRGAKAALEANVDGISFTNRVNYGVDQSSGISKMQDHIVANPDLDAMLGSGAFSYFLGRAVKNEGKTGEITVGGADFAQPTLDLIEEGVMAYTFGQDPYLQGWMPMLQAQKFLDRAEPPRQIDTGTIIVDQSNIGFAKERQEGFRSLLDQHGSP